MPAEMLDREGDGISADAEIGGMSERQQASIAEQQVEAECGDRRDQAVDHQLELIGGDKARNQDQHDEDRHGRGHELEQRALWELLGVGRHHAVPNRPVGRTSSTRAAIR
jgi:hypothetical protein